MSLRLVLIDTDSDPPRSAEFELDGGLDRDACLGAANGVASALNKGGRVLVFAVPGRFAEHLPALAMEFGSRIRGLELAESARNGGAT